MEPYSLAPFERSKPLALEGDEATGLLAQAVARVTELVPYLRAQIRIPQQVVAHGSRLADGQWMLCAELIGDPSWLEVVIRDSGRQLGTEDPAAAASLFVQNYSYRVLTLALACLTTSGVLPDSAASSMAVSLKHGRPTVLAYLNPSVLLLADDDKLSPLESWAGIDAGFAFLVARALEDHLRPLVEATRLTIRVGERLLWGNMAASTAVAFRTMEGCLGPWVRVLGERFFDRCPSQLNGMGAFLALEHGGMQGWFWERTNCCLYDRLPGNIRCSD